MVQGTSGIRLAESGEMIKVSARDLNAAVTMVSNGEVDAMISIDLPSATTSEKILV